jgi:pSer/pThr/pTyr-binding forkhead associated (FHA) protein
VHGFIIFTEQGARIQDVGSLNKTYVNGAELDPNRPYTLESGDELVFGAVPARFITEE